MEGRGRLGRVRHDAVRAARAARTAEEMFAGVIAAVSPVLRSDVWAGITVDPWTLMNTGGNYRDAVPGQLMPRMIDIEYREGDVNSLPDLARRPVPVGLLRREISGPPEHSPRYRDIIGPLGLEDELRVLLRDSRGAWGAIIIGVGDGPPIGPDALALAAFLSRPLGETLRRLHLTERAQQKPSPVSPALVMLDAGYRPLHLTSSVAAWFEDLPPHGRTIRGRTAGSPRPTCPRRYTLSPPPSAPLGPPTHSPPWYAPGRAAWSASTPGGWRTSRPPRSPSWSSPPGRVNTRRSSSPRTD